jgi:hypothetical protein
MRKYRIFKVQFFPSSDVRLNSFSFAFNFFHEKISNFQSSLVFQFIYKIQCIFIRFHFSRKILIFQCLLFSQFRSEIQCISCHFISFIEKISNFQSSLVSQSRCEIQCIIMGFYEFLWKNIELTKLNKDLQTRCSTSCLIYLHLGWPISWASPRQPFVALSIIEAEFVAAAEATKEAVWFQQLLSELGIDGRPPTLYCVNQSATALVNNPTSHQRTNILMFDSFTSESCKRWTQ